MRDYSKRVIWTNQMIKDLQHLKDVDHLSYEEIAEVLSERYSVELTDMACNNRYQYWCTWRAKTPGKR